MVSMGLRALSEDELVDLVKRLDETSSRYGMGNK